MEHFSAATDLTNGTPNFRLRWELLSPGDKVLAAVSGGPDSLCLLHVLWTERQARQLGSVEVAHLDHGLRGAESAAEADWVAAWCAERGIACHMGRVDAGRLAKRGHSVQEAARAARYAFLGHTAASIGADKIATGHTRDDQVETVLANVLRGSGLDGLRGIPERRELTGWRGSIVRPLLDVTRAEVEAYNTANGLRPQIDPSNLSALHYTRNRIRLELLPELRAHYSAGVDAALLRLSAIAARDSDYLALQAAAALADVTRAEDASHLELDRVALTALHPALLRYVLRQAVEKVRSTGEGVTYEHWEAICRAVSAASGSGFTLTLPHPLCRVRVTERSVELSMAGRAALAAWVSAPLSVPGEAVLETLGWTVRAAWEDHPGAVRFDADAVELGSLVVRNRRPGDRIDPLGLGGRRKKVSDILTDAKVPHSERDFVPLVADAQGIVWIAGHTLSERAKETPRTTRRLFLSARNMD